MISVFNSQYFFRLDSPAEEVTLFIIHGTCSSQSRQQDPLKIHEVKTPLHTFNTRNFGDSDVFSFYSFVRGRFSGDSFIMNI